MKHVLILIILAAIATGCADPFSSRDSQIPTGERGTFIQPVSPQIVIFNLEQSYKERIVTNFMKCLDSGFFFKYDFVTKQIGDSDSGWYFDTELRITENIFNSLLSDTTSSLEITLNPLETSPDEVLDTAAILYRSYTIIFVTDSDTDSPDTSRYLGTSIFTITENDRGLWAISRWEDQHQNTNITSWADFKNAYR